MTGNVDLNNIEFTDEEERALDEYWAERAAQSQAATHNTPAAITEIMSHDDGNGEGEPSPRPKPPRRSAPRRRRPTP
jgi:hypothetical protein